MGKRYIQAITSILTIALIFVALLSQLIGTITYGAEKEPNVILNLYDNQNTLGNPIFKSEGNVAEGLWAPGKSRSGILRIYNGGSQRIQVDNLALRMSLKRLEGQSYVTVSDQGLREYFAESMKLTIKKGIFPNFLISNTIYNKSFLEMLYQEDIAGRKGANLSLLDQFSINKNQFIDLEYTVQMKEEADNRLQGVRATVDFVINAHENPVSDQPEDDKDNEDEPVFEEEPVDIIPDIGGHWAHDCIVTLVEHDIVQGYPDGSIKPDEKITRAETAVLIGKALKLEEQDKFFSGYFDPIPGWARGYIITTTEEGIFKGYPGKIFRPGKEISREEMTTVLMRGFDKEAEIERALTFTDRDRISDWALEYVKTAVSNEVILGYPDHTFKPQHDITRAEAFVMICKLLGYHEQHTRNE
ncbi:MAG: hypothetical protein K0R93_2461 [Anaerosolibacter sp.]|jgi:hypothetical protein|uniref:S-layer homology domain-containing protein n=1 Tax=Anaerosolibacter sp. TaxID=1872527 RepID=UPI0026368511|nr:S-layer homology domain-containing protein [Anaerosolibacter sp.]MDF2547563.1 hypothetical protein [Anaerosolibacter sp.]